MTGCTWGGERKVSEASMVSSHTGMILRVNGWEKIQFLKTKVERPLALEWAGTGLGSDCFSGDEAEKLG